MKLLLMVNSVRKCLVLVWAIWLLATAGIGGPAQISPEPQREHLLNGLRILLWNRPGDQDVLLKLRIHSGASFDLGGKAGEMALLGDILFPDPTTHEYFKETMQGRLQVATDYDSITITAQGRASEFERIVETLRTALVTPQITPENVAHVREGRIKILKGTAVSSTMLADRAIAARLFGEFPYGAPEGGSVESLERVERPDLLLARERFLNPNNSTLAIVGGVQTNRAMRTLRQLLGVWRKSEKIVPATFRQPSAPDLRTLLIKAPADQSTEIRLAVRGLARSDRDCEAADILALVAHHRWEKLVPELTRSPLFVRPEAHLLPGAFVMGATVNNSLAFQTLDAARNVLQSLISTPLTQVELEQAKNDLNIQRSKKIGNPDGLAEAWLDIDTYNLPSIEEQRRNLSEVSASDLRRVAIRLFQDAPLASIVLGNSEQLKSQLEPHLKLELVGEVTPKEVAPKIDVKPSQKERRPQLLSNPPTKPD